MNSSIGQKVIFLILSFFCISQVLFAAHIVGGELTYECVGDNNYVFTLIVYRDCASGGAQFDSFGASNIRGTVSIYNGNNLIRNVRLNAPSIEFIPPVISNQCLEVPDNLCVERGVYTFEESLPESDETYTITYSRCCRNATISNIILPGDTGATYTIDITPTSQESCNSSPVFNAFPEIIICVNEPLNFDHSATDSEGDQLVYSFCSPFKGGGNTGGQTGINGVAPNPDAPPPYDNIDFIVPDFTANFPVGGSPLVTIDPVTGVISGTPQVIGQFVVGVCVEEFRNGELLSTVRRDFQFNIENCDPSVQADIVEDDFLGNNSFLLNLCGDKEIQFENQSFGDISDFFWEFDFGSNGLQTFDVWEPFVTFPDTGQYNGVLILNANEICGDTAFITVNVFPEIEPEFEVDYDTCSVGPVSFTDLTQTNGSDIVTYDWIFGDGGTSIEQNPDHIYENFGMQTVTLQVQDNNNCNEEIELDFDWSPVPTEVIVQPNSFIACAPGAEVTFNNLTSPIDLSYDVAWDFGDGGVSDEISPSYTFDEVGTFTISLEITSPFDCIYQETFNDWITIKPGPTANFSFLPNVTTNFSPQVFFADESSSDVVSWQWDFGGESASRDQNPSFVFRDTGLQEVVLLVTSENGCVDTTSAIVDVIPVDSYTLPNAFTPNNDDKNDVYLGVGTLENILDFNMKIWDRWGNMVFESDSQYEGWNGRKSNAGPLLPAGVYVVLVNYESARDGEIQHKGFATLIR
jgi:gliding motility-associated-like protein